MILDIQIYSMTCIYQWLKCYQGGILDKSGNNEDLVDINLHHQQTMTIPIFIVRAHLSRFQYVQKINLKPKFWHYTLLNHFSTQYTTCSGHRFVDQVKGLFGLGNKELMTWRLVLYMNKFFPTSYDNFKSKSKNILLSTFFSCPSHDIIKRSVLLVLAHKADISQERKQRHKTDTKSTPIVNNLKPCNNFPLRVN